MTKTYRDCPVRLEITDERHCGGRNANISSTFCPNAETLSRIGLRPLRSFRRLDRPFLFNNNATFRIVARNGAGTRDASTSMDATRLFPVAKLVCQICKVALPIKVKNSQVQILYKEFSSFRHLLTKLL